MRKLAFLACLLAPLSAEADMMRMGVSSPPAVFAGVGSYGATATMYWGLRAYSAAQCTGSVVALRARRASDSAEQDINILTSCDLDYATLGTFCAATTCHVRSIEQIGQTACAGASCALVQATAGNQPVLTFNALNGRACITSAAAATILTAANSNTPNAAAQATVYFVGRRSVSNAATVMIGQTNSAGNRIQGAASAANWTLNGASGTITRAAAENTFHVAIGVTGTGAVLNIDGGETSGTVAGGTNAGPPTGFRGGTGTTLCSLEAAVFDNIQLSATQRAALVQNARGYWGF